MNSEVKLYIENRQVDLSSDLDIAMTYQLEDITNPTVTKVGYSKTITVEGSQRNNQIFGDIWDLRRAQGYGTDVPLRGVCFDPSKRASAQIYCDGDLVEDGYVKLDSIKRNGVQVQYNLTFYGGLADFFYTLSYDDEGEMRTLASLDYDTDLGFNVTKEAVQAAWASLGNETEDKWKKINFAPCYNGLPDNFSADKAIINFTDDTLYSTDDKSKTDGGKTYKPYNGYALAELEKEYTEWEMRDLRSYLQRPVLSMKAFWEAIKREASLNGYTLDLDKGFFNESNPYYSKTWMTLPMLNAETDSDTTSYSTKFASQQYTISSSPYTFNVDWVATDNLKKTDTYYLDIDAVDAGGKKLLDYGYMTVDIPFQLKMKVNDNKGYSPTLSYRDGIKMLSKIKNRYSSYLVQLLAVDKDGNYVGGSDIHNFTTGLQNGEYKSYSDYGYTPSYAAAERVHLGYFKYDKTDSSNLFNESGTRTFNLTMDNFVPSKDIKFVIRIDYVTYNWDSNYNGKLPTSLLVLTKDYFITYSTQFTNTGDSSTMEYSVYNTVSSGSFISQKKLLETEKSPCDIMLSFTKIFGLYWVKDLGKKTIHIYTRNRYFTGDKVDLTQLVDYSKEQEITPITFDAKYYNMELETEDTYYTTKYKDDYSRTYGSQKINTNYNFDSEINEMYEDNTFKGAVTAVGKSNYYRHFKAPDWTAANGHCYQAPFYDGFTYSLVESGENLEETYDVDKHMDICRYINFSGRPRYDCMPKICFYDGDDGAVDGAYVLLFFNGFTDTTDANGNAVNYWLTDDVAAMYTLNDNSACWWMTYSALNSEGETIAINYSRLPSFGRYYGGENLKQISYSLDFGEPQELYVDYSNSASSTIYSKYWEKFLSDQLDVDSRIMETYVLFNEKIDESWLRKFFFFENSYWILNKITDYVLGGFSTTQCEFIKVQNLSNYAAGQTLSYSDSSLNFSVDTLEVTAGGLTGYVITYTAENVEDLKVTSDSSWVRVKLDADNSRVLVTVDSNTGADVRNTNISISGTNAGGATLTDSVLITQTTASESGLEVSPSILYLDWFDASGSVTVTTESTYTITVREN